MRIIDETMDYFTEEINQKDLMSVKHKKNLMVLNYIEHLLVAASVISGCVSISAFASLVAILIRMKSCAVGLKIFQ